MLNAIMLGLSTIASLIGYNRFSYLDLLSSASLPLPTDRTNPNTYTVSFPDGTRSFRIISTVNNPSGTANKARVCIGDLVLFNR